MHRGSVDISIEGDRGGGGAAAQGGTADRIPTAVTHRDLTWEELVGEAERLGPDARFAGLSDEEVVERLSVGAAQIDAATCRWLEVLAELVVRGVWAEQGGRTPGAWLSWKLGIAPSTAREHVRVALRLREFPRTRDRFAAGRLSYSKVRAVTRCGEPSAEELLLGWADDATAEQLERIARGFRTAERAKRDAARDGEDVGQSSSVRGRSGGDGTRTLTIRGPVEVIAAIEDDIGRLAEAIVDDRLGAGAARTDGRGGTFVRDDDRTGGEVAGSVDDLPADARPPKRVTAADQVEALAAALAVAAASQTPPDTSGLDRDTFVLHAHIDALAEAGVQGTDADTAARAEDVVAVYDDHRRVLGMDRRAMRRLGCEAGIVLVATDGDGSPLDVGRRTRRTTAALRRAVQHRDRGCTFPGCGATRHLHAHHVEHWADGGDTALHNLVLVCSFHHRFVHAKGWRIEVRPDGRHRYRTSISDTPVPRVGVPRGAPAEAVADAAPSTASAASLRPPTYDGSPYDLDVAVATLQRLHEAAHRDLDLAA